MTSSPIAVVVGANGNVGTPVSKAFLSAGYEVILAGRSEEKLNNLKTGTLGSSEKVRIVDGVDAGSESSVKGAADRIKNLIGSRKIDVVVFAVASGLYNNAENPLEGVNSDTIADAFRIKIGGAVNVVNAFIPLAAENAHFLLTGGAAGIKMFLPVISTGASTNAALLGFVKSVSPVVKEKNKVLLTSIQVAAFVGSSDEKQGISNNAIGRAYVDLAKRDLSQYKDEEYIYPQQ